MSTATKIIASPSRVYVADIAWDGVMRMVTRTFAAWGTCQMAPGGNSQD